jgi:chemotaxis protein MotA
MLSSMGDPSSIGAGMSAALITTFYGAIMSNLVLAPVRDKLKLRDANDTAEKEVILEGILSIQAGENPRTIEEKLLAFVPPKDRAKIKQMGD